MKQVTYGSDSTRFYFDVPLDWNVADLTGVNIEAHDADGTEALASTAATLYSSTTLDADADRYSTTFVIAASSEAPEVGEMLTIVGVSGQECVIVKGYDSATLTVTTEQILDNDHEDGDSVLGNVVYYDADVSDTDVFTVGKEFYITWTPAGTGVPFKVPFQITKFQADTSDIERRFQNLYPRAYAAFKNPVDRLDDMAKEAEIQLEVDMRSELMDMHRIVGEALFAPLLMAKMACLWVLGADEDLDDERKALNADFAGKFKTMANLPLWTDTDQDGEKEDTEISSHNHIFLRSW